VGARSPIERKATEGCIMQIPTIQSFSRSNARAYFLVNLKHRLFGADGLFQILDYYSFFILQSDASKRTIKIG